MRIIVTGGGTGGHIYPALAIADKFKEIDENTEILYVGNEVGIEKDIVPAHGYNFKMVHARWLDKKTPMEFIKTGKAVIKGISQSKKIIKEFNPDVVIGTGGYVCVPMLMAAKMMKCATYLHEQNAFPGLANRTLEKSVNNIFLGFIDADDWVDPNMYKAMISKTKTNYKADIVICGASVFNEDNGDVATLFCGDKTYNKEQMLNELLGLKPNHLGGSNCNKIFKNKNFKDLV